MAPPFATSLIFHILYQERKKASMGLIQMKGLQTEGKPITKLSRGLCIWRYLLSTFPT